MSKVITGGEIGGGEGFVGGDTGGDNGVLHPCVLLQNISAL